MERELIISVIVPIYNAEKFVHRAIKSILCQMDGEIELILVNDGSTDRSGLLCDEYSERFSQVRVVHKVNGGLSSARNAGMAVARGEYIVFMDADDYLDSNTCAEIIKVIRSDKPDCIEFGLKYISSTGYTSKSIHKVPKGVLLDKATIRDMILPPLLNLCNDKDHFIHEFAWNKVYRRQIIEKHAVWFDEGRRIWEDRPFVVHYLKYCDSFYSMEKWFYNYVDVAGSLSQRYSMEFFDIILANYRHYKGLFGAQYDFDTQYVNNYWSHSVENMILHSLKQKTSQDQIQQNILNTLKEESVVHWFSKRVPENKFEKETSKLVTAGKAEEALRCYKKKAKREGKRMVLVSAKNQIKRNLRKILGR